MLRLGYCFGELIHLDTDASGEFGLGREAKRDDDEAPF